MGALASIEADFARGWQARPAAIGLGALTALGVSGPAAIALVLSPLPTWVAVALAACLHLALGTVLAGRVDRAKDHKDR